MGNADTFCPFCGAKLKKYPIRTQEPEPPKENTPSSEPSPPMSAFAPSGMGFPFLAVTLLIVACLFVDETTYSTFVLLTALGALSGAAGLALSIVGKIRNAMLGGNKTGNRLAKAGIFLNAGALVFAAFMVFLCLIFGLAIVAAKGMR